MNIDNRRRGNMKDVRRRGRPLEAGDGGALMELQGAKQEALKGRNESISAGIKDMHVRAGGQPEQWQPKCRWNKKL